MRMFELVPNKVIYVIGKKIASRTMLGYLYLLRYGSFKTNIPQQEIREKIVTAQSTKDDSIRLMKEYKNYPIRLCIVRDPVDRFISAFANKMNLDPQLPAVTLEQAIQNIENPTFRQQNQKFVTHIRSQVEMYGTDTTMYTHIFNINQMAQVKALIEQQSGATLQDLHINKGKPEKMPANITEDQRQWIRNRYQEDYTVYGQWM